MQTYFVTIQETVTDTFEVEANSINEALRIAKEKYNACEFVLEPGTLIDTTMQISNGDDEDSDWIVI